MCIRDRYDTIQISKGSLAGVAVGNAVITPDGVVGKVVETGLSLIHI